MRVPRLLALMALVAACGGDPAGPEARLSVAGDWTGALVQADEGLRLEFNLTLNQNGGAVAGTGTVRQISTYVLGGLGGGVMVDSAMGTLSVSGTFVPPAATLQVMQDGEFYAQPMTFTATLDRDRLTGTVDDEWLFEANEPLVLTRVP